MKAQQLQGLDPTLSAYVRNCMSKAVVSHEEGDVIMQSVGTGLWTAEGDTLTRSDPYLAPG